MISKTYISHTDPKIVHNGFVNIMDNIDYNKLISTKLSKKLSNFFIYYFEDPYQTHQKAVSENFHIDGKRFISEDVINALSNCLKDKNSQVRMTAITTLGKIGAPEAILALNGIIYCTRDEEIDIIAKALWVLSRIAFACDNNIIPIIMETLSSKYWKIKIASMHVLGNMGERCSKVALPILIKLLNNSAINKNIISDTIV